MAKNSEMVGWRVFQNNGNLKKNDSWREFKQNASEHIQKTMRQSGGWRAKKAGDSAESQVMISAQYYFEKSLAEVKKRPEPYRRIGAAKSNGQFVAVPIAKSGPDFDICMPNGKSGLIEVKSRRGKRIPISAVGDAQISALLRRIQWQGYGTILVMLWDFGQPTIWWSIDARRWQEASNKGYKSLRAQELDILGVRCEILKHSKGAPDYYSAMLKVHQDTDAQLWPMVQIADPVEVGIDPNEHLDDQIYWEKEENQAEILKNGDDFTNDRNLQNDQNNQNGDDQNNENQVLIEIEEDDDKDE